ncbi:Tyrosine-protein kinase [Fasciola gigantica]|uniref:Tyrosine-protein kinase n=1 Tax=Fasciola gigantica TaxID=46835 RepID=A0A504YCV3_FASGI|nr:Tyrosine-protein kinase [Fasciola gigantica]
MGGNSGKLATSKNGHLQSPRLSSNSQNVEGTRTVNLTVCLERGSNSSYPLDINCQSASETAVHTDKELMVVLYDFTESMRSQISIKRGELVRLLGYSPAGDWSEVETSGLAHPATHPMVETELTNTSTQPSQTQIKSDLATQRDSMGPGGVGGGSTMSTGSGHSINNSAFVNAPVRYRRGWVPTSYLAPANVLSDPNQRLTGHLLPHEVIFPSVGSTSSMERCNVTGMDSKFYITNVHRFPTVVQLIDHHSRSADGLVCPLLYPVPKLQCPTSHMTSVAYSSVPTHAIPSHPHTHLIGGAAQTILPPVPTHPSADSNTTVPDQASFHPRPHNIAQQGMEPFLGLSRTDEPFRKQSWDGWEIDRNEILMRQKLGCGQYGDVYEAIWKRLNTVVAVKTLKQDVNLNVNDFLKEASIMKKLRHRNLVQLLGEFDLV